MAKTLSSFFEYSKEAGKQYPAEVPGQSLFYTLGAFAQGSIPWHCWCSVSCAINATDGWDKMTKHVWTVPEGISEATFHLWGEGGYGAGGSQCQQGVPGGSGAFAAKTITVTPGAQYTLCLGEWNDCTLNTTYTCQEPQGTNAANSISHGIRGSKVYVTGTGLTNFCAEGGSPGATAACNWGCLSWCRDYVKCITDILGRTVGDSDNDRYNRACYYGADYGARGIYSCVRSSCCSNVNDGAAQWCSVQTYYAFTGMQVDWRDGYTPTLYGGTVGTVNCAIVPGPFAAKQYGAVNSKTPYRSVGSRSMSTLWGSGGPSAVTCGGTVCCGGRGGPGAIRIIYK